MTVMMMMMMMVAVEMTMTAAGIVNIHNSFILLFSQGVNLPIPQPTGPMPGQSMMQQQPVSYF